MNEIDPAFSSFVDAYSDAVIGYIQSSRPQAVEYDQRGKRFKPFALHEDMSPTDVDLSICHDWARAFPGIDCATSKDDPNYSAGAVKLAVAQRLLKEEWAVQICAQMQVWPRPDAQ